MKKKIIGAGSFLIVVAVVILVFSLVNVPFTIRTEYAMYTEYRPIIPSEYSFLGVVFLLIGVAVIISGLIAEEKERS